MWASGVLNRKAKERGQTRFSFGRLKRCQAAREKGGSWRGLRRQERRGSLGRREREQWGHTEALPQWKMISLRGGCRGEHGDPRFGWWDCWVGDESTC